MGIVFGKTGSEEPNYTVLYTPRNGNGNTTSETDPFKSEYQIRKYPKYFIAEYEMTGDKDDDSNVFRVLARYIGVFGTPENKEKQPMSMTAPVISEPVIVKTDSKKNNTNKMDMKNMAFVLPFDIKNLEDVPTPTDDRIKIKEVTEKTVAVIAFSGSSPTNECASSELYKLCQALQRDSIKIPGCDDNNDSGDKEYFLNNAKWSVSQYHPPFTLPWLRRNEVWVLLDDNFIPPATPPST